MWPNCVIIRAVHVTIGIAYVASTGIRGGTAPSHGSTTTLTLGEFFLGPTEPMIWPRSERAASRILLWLIQHRGNNGIQFSSRYFGNHAEQTPGFCEFFQGIHERYADSDRRPRTDINLPEGNPDV